MSKNFLVVDDQKSLCWVLSKILRDAGFSVTVANTGAEALKALEDGRIAGVIVDYRLPDMDGFQLFERMRGRQPKLPGVLITSYGAKELQHRALAQGFSAYFDKPFNNRAFVEAVRRIVGGEE